MKTKNLLLTGLIFVSIFTSCTSDDPIDPLVEAYNNASISNGGIMYDKFWSSESNFDQNNPNLTKLSTSSDFFRCKQCHGWDGLGTKGAYINRAPKTTRPNISSINFYLLAKTKTAKELFEALKKTTGRRYISYDLSTYNPTTNNTEGDKMPNLNQLLTDAQIWDIVKFMKEGMFDVTQLYDATYSGTYPTGSMTISNVGKDGNATNGNTYYTTNCSGCHGADGKKLILEGLTLGKFVRTKSHEVQHKVKYGQLGSSMAGKFNITLTQMKDLYKANADPVAFPD
ncbi:MAG: c-type cytochrome [Flavobacteriaceae bacterium]|nr:c-type cytochrome [Flavobacteriaceae bacterium]